MPIRSCPSHWAICHKLIGWSINLNSMSKIPYRSVTHRRFAFRLAFAQICRPLPRRCQDSFCLPAFSSTSATILSQRGKSRRHEGKSYRLVTTISGRINLKRWSKVSYWRNKKQSEREAWGAMWASAAVRSTSRFMGTQSARRRNLRIQWALTGRSNNSKRKSWHGKRKEKSKKDSRENCFLSRNSSKNGKDKRQKL